MFLDDSVGHRKAQAGAAGVAGLGLVLGVKEQVQEDLLQLSGVAEDGRQLGMQVWNDLDTRGLELVLKQSERVVNYAIQVHVVELGARGAREIQQAVNNLGGAKRLPRDLVQQLCFLRISTDLLGQH